MKKTKKDAVIYTFLVLLITISVYFLVSFILKPVPATVFDRGDFSNYLMVKKQELLFMELVGVDHVRLHVII